MHLFLKTIDAFVGYLLRLAAHIFFRDELSILLSRISILEKTSSSPLLPHEDRMLMEALMAGEDRRFFFHSGVDTKGLARVMFMFLRNGIVQGASTITQQLVRVITRDYRYSLHRKLKEMCLASAIDKVVPKQTQATLYLRVGYFGWRMTKIAAALHHLLPSRPISAESAAAIVACLRYPRPKNPTTQYLERLGRRSRYIQLVMGNQDNT